MGLPPRAGCHSLKNHHKRIPVPFMLVCCHYGLCAGVTPPPRGGGQCFAPHPSAGCGTLTSVGSRKAGGISSSNTSFCVVFRAEKKCYWESYITGPLELDLDPRHRNYLDNEGNRGSRQRPFLSHAAGTDPNAQRGACEMSVDEPTGTESLCGTTPSRSSWSSCSSHDTCTKSGGKLQNWVAKSLSWPLLIWVPGCRLGWPLGAAQYLTQSHSGPGRSVTNTVCSHILRVVSRQRAAGLV